MSVFIYAITSRVDTFMINFNFMTASEDNVLIKVLLRKKFKIYTGFSTSFYNVNTLTKS